MDIDTALRQIQNLGVALNDDDTAALDTLCDFVEKTINRPLVSDFSLDEVKLPYDQWDKIQRDRLPSLSDEARLWLERWNNWDLACSPMDDDERRLIRLGHYLGWFHCFDR